MPQFLLHLLLAAAALADTGVPSNRATDTTEQSSAKLSGDEEKVLQLTNKARAKEKLPALTLNPVLCTVARAHSANMAARGDLKHELDGKKPGDRVKAAGYDYAWVGENIAVTDGDSPAELFRQWMESPHHKDNILRDAFTEIGIGSARNDKGDIYYTQVFASPRKKRAP
jgi:uncharacterized protein YkwD